MKFDDVKIIEEGMAANLFGRGAAAGFNSKFGKQKGQTQEHILAQDIFLTDFTSDALGAIQSAIDAGLIYKEKKTRNAKAKVVDPAAVADPQAPAQAQPAQAKAVRPQGDGGKAAQAAVQATNNYIKGISQQMSKIQDPKQKMELSKELVNYMKDRQGYAEWENGVKTAEMVLKKNLDPKFAMGLIGQLKRPLKQAQQTQRQNPSAAPKGNVQEAYGIYMLNKLAEACGFTLKQLGYTVLTEGSSNKYRLVPNNYLKLDGLFESILGEKKAVDNTGKKTMSQFLNDWLARYMAGIPEAEYGPALKGIVDEFANSWNKTGTIDQTILKKLGQGSYAATKSAGINPAGTDNIQKDNKGSKQNAQAPVQNAQAQAQQQAQPAVAAQNGHQQAQAIKSSLNKLYSVDQVVYNDLVKSLQQKPVKSTPAVAMTGNENPNQVGGPKFTDVATNQAKPAVTESAKRAERVAKLRLR